ncbi:MULTISPECIES: ABC transporter ATP-binding protein [Clostridium]|jgi:ATP-binding cassette subfamily B multidrug efflux pump|uniref:Multidrug ABC transporter ATP-binding protein n=2 Tax=Clostridium TaxID=1485 RepID=A0A0D1AL68_CLOBO|nr:MULTISPECIES: ABC transporter ATP-binding protein [Clostridium]MBE6075856.1 ABC transporter ATP-binding protein [Clostridium lundense]MDU2831401.1 ABC transporter ATP-binding protein [Clostridium botulinum]KIS23889.1 multidrug ABC transporter ATP-binding protein [Clostridium botulinum B2 450]MCW7998742.1 ABC transporter ATP-binding protein [Clostridium sp. cpc1]MDU4547695.1 ABC transporter ATP-binding protein [Clostridium botulinum]
MKLILQYLKKYKLYVFCNILAVLGFAAAELGIPTIVSNMIDRGIVLKDRVYIYKLGIVILILAIIGGIGNIVLAYCSSKVSTSITRDIRNDIFKKAQGFSHREYNKFGVSSMITRTTNDAFILMQFINVLLRMAFLTPIMILISMFMVIKTSVTLSMVIGGCIPIICFGVYLIARTSNPISTRQQKGMDRLNRITRENLTGVRVIRAFRKDHYETQRFYEANEDYASNAKKLFKLMSVAQPAFFLLLNLAVVIVFIMSSKMIDVGTLQVGKLVAFQEYMFHAMFSMMLFSMIFVMYPRAEISARRIQELLEEEPIIKNPENAVTKGDERGTLEFDHVTFQYPDGEVPVLHDISFQAKKGEKVAFIGSTGSGKSTLINLIPRFYDVTKGSIKVDGVDVRKYDLISLRQKIGFIPQKALLFSGSINENIRYGKHNAVQSEIEHSAKVSQAYDFIKDKPDQFEEMIEEGGSNVSGGQKQRLSIARAVVRKPNIYIFDDSFSALDSKTDAKLRKRLKSETTDAITLIVAQKVSSIMDATKIIVLNEGEVVGIGTHEQLLRNCKIYYEIAASQMSKEELKR